MSTTQPDSCRDLNSRSANGFWFKSVWGATAFKINVEVSWSGELILKRVAAQQSA